jgi:hypothetical protein
MPHIIVRADGTDERDLHAAVTLRERINVADFESERFASNLVERLGWAVLDAAEVESSEPADRNTPATEREAAQVDRKAADAARETVQS